LVDSVLNKFVKLKNVAIAMHCNLKPPDTAPALLWGPYQVWSRSTYPLLSYSDFTPDIYVTLWPWPVTLWPLTLNVLHIWNLETVSGGVDFDYFLRTKMFIQSQKPQCRVLVLDFFSKSVVP